jgi:hypothetical protein
VGTEGGEESVAQAIPLRLEEFRAIVPDETMLEDAGEGGAPEKGSLGLCRFYPRKLDRYPTFHNCFSLHVKG